MALEVVALISMSLITETGTDWFDVNPVTTPGGEQVAVHVWSVPGRFPVRVRVKLAPEQFAEGCELVFWGAGRI